MPTFIGVVIRQLPNNRPVTSEILKAGTWCQTKEEAESDLSEGFEKYKKEFVSKFVEFKDATWYLDVFAVY